MGGLASMPIIGRVAKPLKSETVQEGIASISEGGMKLYEMVIAKVMKEGKKIGESGRVDSYKHPDRPDITVDVNQTDGSAEIYFDTDKGSKGYAKIDRDMETGGTDLTEAEEVYNDARVRRVSYWPTKDDGLAKYCAQPVHYVVSVAKCPEFVERRKKHVFRPDTFP